jgi:putative transposase
MPWKVTSPMTERMAFLTACAQEPTGNFSALCRRFGISRKTGYKWLTRFEQEQQHALLPRTSRPHTSPSRIETHLLDSILQTRKQFPTWGPKKIRAHLQAQFPEKSVPAASTIGDYLKSYGLILARKVRLRVPLSTVGLVPGEFPNELWCVDFKGDFPLKDQIRCYPLTITDAHSRYLIKCEGLTSTKEEGVRREFERAFREYGLPKRIRSDNGVPFASTALGGLTPLSVWWMKLGIEVERIQPGHPEQNGSHERMHRTLKNEAVRPKQLTLLEQQREFDRFRAEYNRVRPHEALGQKTPEQVYCKSPREYPRELRVPEYEDEYQMRHVASNGILKWKSSDFFVGKSLTGELLGLKKIKEEEWALYYGKVPLGTVEKKGGEWELKRKTLHRREAGSVNQEADPATEGAGSVDQLPDPVTEVSGSVSGGF